MRLSRGKETEPNINKIITICVCPLIFNCIIMCARQRAFIDFIGVTFIKPVLLAKLGNHVVKIVHKHMV